MVFTYKENKQRFNSSLRQSFLAKPVIACIDDSRTVQRLVRAILSRADYRVLSITKPTEQLLELFNHKPSLILMDINMPDISGYELCQIIRSSRSTKDIPIVLLTGAKGMIPYLHAKFHPNTSYLRKPCTAPSLIETVKKSLQ